MDYLVRPATLADKTAIAPFVTDTFDWGDYVQDRYEDWLTDKASYNAVAVHDGANCLAYAYDRLKIRHADRLKDKCEVS